MIFEISANPVSAGIRGRNFIGSGRLTEVHVVAPWKLPSSWEFKDIWNLSEERLLVRIRLYLNLLQDQHELVTGAEARVLEYRLDLRRRRVLRMRMMMRRVRDLVAGIR